MASAASAAGAPTLACTVAHMGSMASPQAAMRAVVLMLIVVFIIFLVKSRVLLKTQCVTIQAKGMPASREVNIDGFHAALVPEGSRQIDSLTSTIMLISTDTFSGRAAAPMAVRE